MTDSIAERARRLPLPYDRKRAGDVVSGLPEALQTPAWRDLLGGTAGSSPYLAHLITRRRQWLGRNAHRPAGDIVDTVLRRAARNIRGAAGEKEVAQHLRWAKPRTALVIALADLAGVWSLMQVTRALTETADRLVAATVDWLIGQEIARGKLPGLGEADRDSGGGYVVLAMGKHGARELNFSSDVDLICLFDQDRFEPDDFAEAKARYIRLTRTLVRLLSDPGGGGYVFRTDLRLRPSPSTTPVCMAMEPAERYYESVGRTWERAAHIKARPVAGDLAAGRAYLDRLQPFVWRRHLDFTAIEDTHEMLRRIRRQQGRFAVGDLPGTDIKLDPGGIREIELFAQTRQLITGGRHPEIRCPRTLDALAALAAIRWVRRDTAETLAADYVAHRELEHRLQMQEDAQTHLIPRSAEARARVAHLSGSDDVARFERDTAARLARVHALTEEFFRPGEEQRTARAERRTLSAREVGALGFERPEDAHRVLSRWRSGGIAATRSSRARELFTGLEPQIVARLADAASPDQAIAMFDRFLSGLPAGVQVFSLFAANPHLLDLIVEICAAAPRLARHLGENPRALDALLTGDFFEPLAGARVLAAQLSDWLGDERDYERLLDLTRLWAREQTFRAGVQVLRALADPVEAGGAFSAVAEAVIRVLMPRVVAEFAGRHGRPPGRGMAVIALGRLGSREMTAGSDLDLITVYDAGGAEGSDGRKPLATSAYFPRLTQALLSALTAPTAEGRLYEVDMRLRPSGRSGPVAVSLAGFDGYQRDKAWVWEHMALTRARVIAGEPSLADDIRRTVAGVLAARRGSPAVMAEAAEMRTRLIDAHRGERGNVWSLKHVAGGLMEVEFMAQAGVLAAGLTGVRTARGALPKLAAAGWLDDADAAALGEAMALMQQLQHMERVALELPFDPKTCGEGLKHAMLRATEATDFADLERRLAEQQEKAAAIVAARFDGAADGADGG